MKYLFKPISQFYLLLLLGSCVEPYSPPEVSQAKTYLVVDGFLNVANQPSRIKLSRTQRVDQAFAPHPELKAKLRVEGKQGASFDFLEEGDGTYSLGQQSFNANEEYRLKITLADGSPYLSDYVPVKITPPIQALKWKVDPTRNGVNITLSTADPSNKTWFYRWQYEETWQYHSTHYSVMEVENQEIVRRKENNSIYTCYKTQKQPQILLSSSIKQSQDLIKDFPLTFVSGSTNKLTIRYSILVTEFALTQEEFEYWTKLQKTTENTGGLFDAPPSRITGNIQCVNRPDELVFGYFSATRPEQKRIFIDIGDFKHHSDWVPNYRYPICELDSLSYADALHYSKSGYIIIGCSGQTFCHPNQTKGFLVGPPSCADCRDQGGVVEIPSFW